RRCRPDATELPLPCQVLVGDAGGHGAMRRRRLPAEKPQTPRAFDVGSTVGGWGGGLIMTNPPRRCANASATDSAEGGGCKVRIRRILPAVARSREGPLAEPIAGARACRWELVFMRRSGRFRSVVGEPSASTSRQRRGRLYMR